MSNRLFIATITMLFAGVAQAALVWQPAPPEKTPKTSSGSHAGHGGHGGGKSFVLHGALGGDTHAEAELWLPTRVRRPLHLMDNGTVSVQGTGLNSYHMLFAKRREGASEEVAMRYLSLRGKPAEASPADLVEAPKAALDITPAPLTREHQRYQSLKPANFIVRFRGTPLALHPVLMTTSNGSEIVATTDEQGRISLELPDDFSDVQAGRSNNRPADFVVSAELKDGGERYHTTVSAPYYVSPSHWQSFSGGLAALLAGMVSGFVVLQRSRKNGGEERAGEA